MIYIIILLIVFIYGIYRLFRDLNRHETDRKLYKEKMQIGDDIYFYNFNEKIYGNIFEITENDVTLLVKIPKSYAYPNKSVTNTNI